MAVSRESCLFWVFFGVVLGFCLFLFAFLFNFIFIINLGGRFAWFLVFFFFPIGITIKQLLVINQNLPELCYPL